MPQTEEIQIVLTEEQIEAENERLKEEADELGKLIAITRRDCINSYYDFFVEFWDLISSDELVLNWHIKYMCDRLQMYGMRIVNGEEANDVIFNIPPGMSKSSIVSVGFPVWLWLHKPDCITISSSYAADISIDHSIKSKTIYKSERYQRYFQSHFGETFGKYMHLVKDNEKNWANNFGGARIATSTGATITGKHGHLILRDDPINPEQAESSAYRIKSNRFNDRTLSNRKKDKNTTPTITVMQRLHMEDPTGHDLAKASKNIELIKLPAEVTDDVRPPELKAFYVDGLLDPIRLTRKVLDGQLEDLLQFGYSGQYRQDPTPSEGGIFKRNWFTVMGASEVPFNPEEIPLKFMTDGAFTDNTKNDPSAQMAYRVYDGKLYIYRCDAVRKLLPQYLLYARGFMKGNGYGVGSINRVEMKSSGPAVKSMLAQEAYGGFNMGEINSKHVSWGKMTRAEYASPTVEGGKVVLIRGGWNNLFVEEVANFPNDAHDDMLDLLCYSVLQEISGLGAKVIKTTVNLQGKII